MGIVRRHKRVTVSGRVVTVRQHTRDYDSGPDGNERRPAAEDAAPARNVAALPPAAEQEGAETWWDDSEAPREPWMDDNGDDDDERYRQRAAYLESHPDAAALLADEQSDRGAADVDDAVQRMIAERASDEPQWQHG